MRIWFLRHGKAAHNVAADAEGCKAYYNPDYKDAPLVDAGRTQAQRVGLPCRDFSAIYCSPLKRCRETLQLTAARCVDRVFLDDNLMEPQGFHYCNYRAEKAELAASVLFDTTRVAEINPYITAIHVPDPFAERVQRFTEGLLRETETKTDAETEILVVTHYDWMKEWSRQYLGEPLTADNCELWGVKKLTDGSFVLTERRNVFL